MERHTRGELLRFLLPSMIGVWVFLVPFPLHGEMNTLIGHIKELLVTTLEPWYTQMVAGFALLTALLACAARFLRPDWIERNHILSESLGGGALWFSARLLALPIALAVYIGSQYYTGTGSAVGTFISKASFIVHNTAPRIIVLALLLGLWAPLIMDFGLVQFIAVYASPVMRPLFRVPGRAAVDCVASWLGSSSMAVVFTAKMYDAGFYTQREAAAIVCGFSLAGIYNIYAVAELLDMTYAITSILSVIYLVMTVLAMIMPRIWPLRSIPDEYYMGRDRYHHLSGERNGRSAFRWALKRASSQARRMTPGRYLSESMTIACVLIFGTVPLMITFGTLLVIAAETTRIVSLAAAPLSSVLAMMGAAESEILASSAVFAFVDQFLAVTAGRLLLTEQARFICICMTFCGLINLTEVGLHVWHSNIPLSFGQMTAVYVIRVFLSLALIIPAALLLFP